MNSSNANSYAQWADQHRPGTTRTTHTTRKTMPKRQTSLPTRPTNGIKLVSRSRSADDAKQSNTKAQISEFVSMAEF